MESHLLSELSLAIAKGDVALWLGPNWKQPAPIDVNRIQVVDWLGAWVENSDAGLLDRSVVAPQTKSGRLIIEVDNRIEDVLGKHFSVADVCPHFYLNGRDISRDSLSPRSRRISRDEKVQLLGRLKSSVLIVAGYDQISALGEHLLEMGEAAPDCRLFVLTGIQENEKNQLVEKYNFDFSERIASYGPPLQTLLQTIERRRSELPVAPSIRIGKESVLLDRLLKSEPPFDQEFIIVKERDIRDPEVDESIDELLVSLISGRTIPWRSFAHRAEWQRPLPHRREALRRLSEIRRGPPKVSCLNIPAEPGAGLTTLLQQIAFDSACEGAPTFIHRAQGELDYDRLRSFLTNLGTSVEGRSVAHEPSVLIFDCDSVRADSTGQLRTIAARMARDGRRVLLIRGIPVRSVAEVSPEFKKLHHSLHQGEVFDESWTVPLQADLDTSQQQSILSWASERLERAGKTVPLTAARLIHSWKSEAGDVPLLIFLYSILTGDLRDAAGLGKHLVNRFLEIVKEKMVVVAEPTSSGDEPLSGDSLNAAVAILQANWRRMPTDSPPTSDDLSAGFIMLAAMACLRLGITRSILADLISLRRTQTLEVVRWLEAGNLARTDLVAISTNDATGTLAASAFYTREDAVGLLHPAYGRLILEWLKMPEATSHRQLIFGGGVTDRVLNSIDERELTEGFPIRLLKPIFTSLKPTESHVRFAENVAMRYLRLQKGRHQEELAKWQWRHVPLLREVFGWLDEQVIRQSASLLHSRGITNYKSCRPGIDIYEVRQRYKAAEDDFERALELSRTSGAERPVNLMTSLGLLYLGWLEREREEGNHAEAEILDRKVEATLRAALAETPDSNRYAVYGLISYLVSRYSRTVAGESTSPTPAATDLAEAIELLQIEPEAYFEDEWNELRRKAISFLGNADAQRIIHQLKHERNELGYVLEALQILGGSIPDVPTEETAEIQSIRAAAAVLRVAQDSDIATRSHLADLLRYALFSADSDRLKDPAYRRRFDLISKLIGSRYLDVPIWLYDYAMLCFQVGQYGEGADAYSRLRKGKRFFEVSRDRSCWLTDGPESLKPALVFLRVISVEGAEGKAWGRVEHPHRLRDPVPLSVRTFRSRGKAIQIGHSLSCQISLNPAGPFAEPPGAKEA